MGLSVKESLRDIWQMALREVTWFLAHATTYASAAVTLLQTNMHSPFCSEAIL